MPVANEGRTVHMDVDKVWRSELVNGCFQRESCCRSGSWHAIIGSYEYLQATVSIVKKNHRRNHKKFHTLVHDDLVEASSCGKPQDHCEPQELHISCAEMAAAARQRQLQFSTRITTHTKTMLQRNQAPGQLAPVGNSVLSQQTPA